MLHNSQYISFFISEEINTTTGKESFILKNLKEIFEVRYNVESDNYRPYFY
jgi:hypothetical protein